MKTLKTPLVIVSTLIIATLLLSWSYNPVLVSSASSGGKSILTQSELLSYMAEQSDEPETVPAAEDVLVQRIKGDDSHLLLMAFYSKENYAAPTLTIENGFTIVLRDDGKGVDKTAGDGLYTARIPADVKAFRQQAGSMLRQMKAGGYKPFRYINRQLLLDPDAAEGFAVQQFDGGEPVSISALTNALSADLPAAASQSARSGSSAPLAKSTATAATSVTATATLTTVPVTTLDSIRQNSIFITNLAVVEDPTRTWNYCTQTGNATGVWTFGTLMRQLASKNPLQIATDAQVSDYVKSWLNNWAITQVINEDTVQARTLVNSKILTPWLNKSQSAGAPAGQLDMRFAPFKLTAIANRFDLRDGQRNGVPGSPLGEGRFVYCLINSNCKSTLAMTIIFEYGINKPNTCESKLDWAQQWVNLKNFALGSSEYNQALQNITDQFALCGTNPLKPNQSSLNQLRTNEITLAPSTPTPRRWELREFIVDSATGNLVETTVGKSPADKYNAQVANAEVQRMVNFVNKNRKAIKAQRYTVPLTWKGFPFLGGKSHIDGPPTGNPPNVYHWNGTDSTNSSTFIVDNNARSNFSLETCAGCLGGEAQVAFTHVDTAFFGNEASLSGFMTGIPGKGGAIDFDNDTNNNKMTVKDAALRPSATNPKIRVFNDIDRRAKGLKSFVSTTCGTVLSISSELMFQPTNMVH